ncbi:hypothetical protein BU16DRAFT_89948 [Lophium mytilinum]|uniref:BTB domain-containing protein n=1 Tax=Lophium mytilinum TaxID=390894 RepID=A0A6A6QKA1_9PEZI|nr:hypothetical protein BU16DRAFT_89948 [Lophium mytilinum]
MPTVTRLQSTRATNGIAKPQLKDPREQKARKLAYFGRTMVQVCVGEDDRQEKFAVHDTPLRSHSKFFANAMNGSWKESDERIIKLPDDSPETFELYIHYIYTGKLAIVAGEGVVDDDRGTRQFVAQLKALAYLYVFVEKILDSACKNDVVDAMVACVRDNSKIPPLFVVEIIYNGTAGPCSARKFLVDVCARWSNAKYFKDRRERFPVDFTFDVITKMLEYRKAGPHLPKSAPDFVNGAQYYDTDGSKDAA